MPRLSDIFGTIIPSAILQAIGTPEQQRAAAEKARIEAEERRRFDILRELQRETMAETRRQHDLQYGPTPTEIDVPGVGKVSGPRWAIPALIQAAVAGEQGVSLEELGALGTLRERIVSPKVGAAADLEAEATRKAFPQFAGEVSGLNVDLPQGLRLPRTSVEKMFTEAGQQRKELATEERQNLQRMSTAAYRGLYDQLISENVPHSLANATAIDLVTRKYGIAPEHQAFVPTPTERPEPKMRLEDEALKVQAKPPVTWTPRDKWVMEQYEAQKARPERPQTPFQATVEIAGGDLEKALEIYRRDPERMRAATERRASFVLEEARRQTTASLSNIERQLMKPEEYDARVRTRVQQLMQGESPEVQEMVSSMAGLRPPKQGLQIPPSGDGRAATRGEVEDAKRRAGGDSQKARQLLIQQGIDPTLPLVE